MIAKAAIKKYLNRRLESYDWMKDARKREIDEAIRDLDPVPDFHNVKLYLHQKVCFLLLVTLCRFMLFLDMGGGKTLVTLLIISYRKQMGEKVKAIVFVPYLTAVETWVEETEKHTPHLKCFPLLGTGKENLTDLAIEEADLFVITYQSAAAMCSDRIEAKGKKTKGGKAKVQWNFQAAKIKKIFKSFDMLVMDEIHKIKNQSSLYYRLCRAISKNCDWVLGLTGTPFGREPLDLWAQFFVVDLGDTLGDTLGMFREVFYTQSPNFWGGQKYSFKKKMKGTLHEMIKNRSMRYEITECHDMPSRVYQPKNVPAHKAMLGYYNAAVDKIEELKKHRKMDMHAIESSYHQLRQLASGFLTLKGEDDSKAEIEFPENPKLDILMDLVDAMPDGHKMIVFHDYVYTNTIISKGLTKAKVGHARIYGKTKDPIAELRRFKRDPKCRVLVINSKSGSSSLNLQNANYVVFFEQPTSAIDREQAERRAWRPGQEWPVFIIDIIMSGTTDEKQRQSNIEGRNLLKNVLDGKQLIGRLKVAA